MEPDWHKLAPHLPLDAGDASYVVRPDDVAARIANALVAGRNPVLLCGPSGVGKSTELAQLPLRLGDQRTCFHVALDRGLNMRSATPRAVLTAIYRGVADSQNSMHIHRVALDHRVSDSQVQDALLDQLRRTSPRPALAIDGLEKSPPEVSGPVFDILTPLVGDADFVVVVPWHAAYGPNAQHVIGVREQLISVQPLPTGDDAGDFYARLLARRLLQNAHDDASDLTRSGPQDTGYLIAGAAGASGGIPRIFLQLLADAGMRARTARGEQWMTATDLEAAVLDQRDSFRRLLLPGDTEVLRAVDGTDGRELELERKLRLLNHGILLERVENGDPLLNVHPIVKQLLIKP